ncbi:MAG: hypothetical protein JXL97_11520 [Bacteroidales bacterium]|nr:hypothetical protein [Bacteroidales bacterium]
MKILLSFFFVLFFFLTNCNTDNESIISENNNDPTRIIDLAGYRYGLYGNRWYTMANENRGDLVDTCHVILRLVNDGDVNNYDFTKISLPKLNVIRVLTDSYYEVEIPSELNSFDTAEKLWNSGDFQELVFNVFISVY